MFPPFQKLPSVSQKPHLSIWVWVSMFDQYILTQVFLQTKGKIHNVIGRNVPHISESISQSIFSALLPVTKFHFISFWNFSMVHYKAPSELLHQWDEWPHDSVVSLKSLAGHQDIAFGHFRSNHNSCILSFCFVLLLSLSLSRSDGFPSSWGTSFSLFLHMQPLCCLKLLSKEDS